MPNVDVLKELAAEMTRLAGLARAGEVKNSARYTAPHAEHYDESSRWVPIIMGILLAGGLLVIMSRYFFWDSNLPTVIGLGLLLSGLFMATKWK